MRMVQFAIMAVTITVVFAQPIFADEISELKSMVQELKNDYEGRIKTLEAKIEQLETSQSQEVAQLREEIEEGTLNVDYVGRQHDGPFEKGGLVVEDGEE